MKHFRRIYEIAQSSKSYSEYMMKMNLNGFSKAKSHGFLRVYFFDNSILPLVKDGCRQGEISLKFLLNCL